MHLLLHSPDSTVWVNFLYTGGSESPAITAKIKFIIGVIWGKKKNDDITYTHAHTHEVEWKLDFPNFRMFRFEIFFLTSF